MSRKTGPADGYLWQYRVTGDGAGGLRFEKVREFGAFSGGEGEIEAIFVDDALGYVYYSDEWKGIRKYAADPDSPEGNRELALFGLGVFQEDREGLSLYALDDKTGYLLASDQQAGSQADGVRELGDSRALEDRDEPEPGGSVQDRPRGRRRDRDEHES